MEVIKRDTHFIDATDRIMGKLATEVAVLLRGKNKVGFLKHVDAGDFVSIKNIDKMKVTGKKMDGKIYYRHSGYLGSLKETTMREMIDKKGQQEVLRKAVMGMLAKNRLRARLIKRLKFEK